MPSIACKCGERLSYGDIPNPIEWLLISDTDFDQGRNPFDTEALNQEAAHMVKCPSCRPLWIYWGGFRKAPTCYDAAD
ncbi:hypothetical protein GAO09_05645 [Rhizobiales bacterium RZME27]|uniref:Uncharacterized protein n=1 Tax=Endobacterium cereale TaxID=2663029 RepID=A0A6A8A8H2_9HYPH|nr:hypothetical protein [Endobacterium cereale]MEB2843620.1 hypothetical protein [Endobacterium cereale]MQY45546.1 hypothetical protein [Endobacterium cereale]